MRRSCLSSTFILLFVFASHAAAKDNLAPGAYCLRDVLKTSRGDPLGEFQADVEVRRSGRDLLISFSDHMPDSGQDVDLGPAKLRAKRNGEFTFEFVDNWDAKGAGTLKLAPMGISIAIRRTSKASDSWGNNVDRNYGNFNLKSAPCHPVSR